MQYDTKGRLGYDLLEDLEIEIEGLNKRATKFESEVSDLKDEISNKKEVINHSKSLMEKYKTQQDNVRNNKEFEALAKEIKQPISKNQQWSLRSFSASWQPVLSKYPQCRYTVMLYERSNLVAPRDRVQGIFYTRIRK